MIERCPDYCIAPGCHLFDFDPDIFLHLRGIFESSSNEHPVDDSPYVILKHKLYVSGRVEGKMGYELGCDFLVSSRIYLENIQDGNSPELWCS